MKPGFIGYLRLWSSMCLFHFAKSKGEARTSFSVLRFTLAPFREAFYTERTFTIISVKAIFTSPGPAGRLSTCAAILKGAPRVSSVYCAVGPLG